MKAVGKIALVAVVAAMVVPALVVPALAAEFHSFGRAGGVVGAERVEQIASYVSPQDLREFDAGYGRAGGAAAAPRPGLLRPTERSTWRWSGLVAPAHRFPSAAKVTFRDGLASAAPLLGPPNELDGAKARSDARRPRFRRRSGST